MQNSEADPVDAATRKNFFPLIAITVAITLSIRWTIANGDSLWLDELHTAWAVDDGLSQVAARAADGNQNPLFFWLTWFCTQLLGHTQFSVRLVSVVAGTTLAGVAGWLTWRGSTSTAGVLLTGLIVALDWRFVFYGTEARPYALVQLLGAIHATLFASLCGLLPKTETRQRNPSFKWATLTLLSIALFYCHITSVWLFASELLFLSVVIARLKFSGESSSAATDDIPIAIRPLLFSFATALVGCLPGLLNLTTVLGRKSNWSNLSSPAAVLAENLGPIIFWMSLPLLLSTAGWLLQKFSRGFSHLDQANSKRNRFVLFVFLWAITPTVGICVVHYLNIAPMALSRYALVGTPAMAIFAGLMIGRIPGFTLKLITIAAIAWSSYANNEITRQLVDRQTLPVLRHEDWDSNESHIALSAQGDKPVLLFANVIEDTDAADNDDPDFQEYLRFPVHGLRRSDSFTGRQIFACPTHRSPRLHGELIKNVIQQRGAWLLIRGSDATVQSIVTEIAQTLSAHLPTETEKTIRIREQNEDGDVVHLFSVDLL
jgi:hypothetical protein